jgi:hypothetical protein
MWLFVAAPQVSLRARVALVAFCGLAHATALNVHTVAAKPVLAAGGAVVLATAFIAAVIAIAQSRTTFAALATPAGTQATSEAETGTETDAATDAATDAGTVTTVADPEAAARARAAMVQTGIVFAAATAVSLFGVWSRSNFGSLQHDFAVAAQQRAAAGVVLALTIPASAFAARIRNRRLAGGVLAVQLAAIAVLATPAPLAAGLGGEAL